MIKWSYVGSGLFGLGAGILLGLFLKEGTLFANLLLLGIIIGHFLSHLK